MHLSVRQAIKTAAGCVAGISLTLSAALFAADEIDAAKIMEQRHENFEEMGESFKTIRDQLRGDNDMEAVYQAALTINGHAKNIDTWFPAGTGPETGIETEAKPEIWQQREEFSKAAQNLAAKSGDFLKLAETRDASKVAGGVMQLGGACKNCHDQFRVDDD